MNPEKHKSILLTEMEKHKAAISNQLDLLINNLSEKITGIGITIFTSQDGDGMFSIHCNADGPDLYVRQKEIQEYAYLFNPKFVDGMLEPWIPRNEELFEDSFEMNDFVIEIVSEWFLENFKSIQYPEQVKFQLMGHDGIDITKVTPLN